MDTRDVLAVDFGTANSYYCKCAGDQLSPQGVDFGGGRDGLATAVLYREGKSPLVGDVALEEYGEATDRERKGYRLRTHFKPDIATGEQARQCARDFLSTVLAEAERQRLHLDPSQRQVIFGAPSEAGPEYRQALGEIAREAGYGEVRVLDEPKGALLDHVFRKDLPAGDALGGLLVIDFGGGTCDFAFLQRGKIRSSWGDLRLGGRLFDDLFYQWFLDSNPGAEERLAAEGSEYFVHAYLCREAKEFFSRTMARDRAETGTKAIRHYGRIAEMTWDSFVARAGAYRPSETLRRFLAELGGALPPTESQSDTIDLIGWFRRCLVDGLRSSGIGAKDIRFVILTGGSSQWPFVGDIVEAELATDPKRIMRSDRPYAAIAEGLSILPALQIRFQEARQRLRTELPEFRRKQLEPLIRRRTHRAAEHVVGEITRELFDQRLKPVLVEFRQRGGDIAGLKQHLAAAVAAYEPALRTALQTQMRTLSQGLPSEIAELLTRWFSEHGLAAPHAGVSVRDMELDRLGGEDLDLPDFYGGLIDTVAYLTAGVVASIVAGICGGSGMALIASGPLGWIIGAALGLIASVLAAQYGAEEAKKRAEKWPVPGWILRRTLSDRKIRRARERFAAELESQITEALEPVRAGLVEQVRQHVEGEIEALSEIHKL